MVHISHNYTHCGHLRALVVMQNDHIFKLNHVTPIHRLSKNTTCIITGHQALCHHHHYHLHHCHHCNHFVALWESQSLSLSFLMLPESSLAVVLAPTPLHCLGLCHVMVQCYTPMGHIMQHAGSGYEVISGLQFGDSQVLTEQGSKSMQVGSGLG